MMLTTYPFWKESRVVVANCERYQTAKILSGELNFQRRFILNTDIIGLTLFSNQLDVNIGCSLRNAEIRLSRENPHTIPEHTL